MPLSGLNVEAEWTPASGTAYTVEHWLENANDTGYTLTGTDNLSGTTLEETEAEENTYDGFTVQPYSQAVIAADGSTVVKIYYNRNEYSITFDSN